MTLHGTDLAHPRSRAITLGALRLLDLVAAVSGAARAPRVPRAHVPRARRGAALRRRPAAFARSHARRPRPALGLDPERRYLLFPADPARPEKRHDRGDRRCARPGSRCSRSATSIPSDVPLWVNAANAVLVPSDARGLRAGGARGAGLRRARAGDPGGDRAGGARRHSGYLLRPVQPRRWRAALAPHLADGSSGRRSRPGRGILQRPDGRRAGAHGVARRAGDRRTQTPAHPPRGRRRWPPSCTHEQPPGKHRRPPMPRIPRFGRSAADAAVSRRPRTRAPRPTTTTSRRPPVMATPAFAASDALAAPRGRGRSATDGRRARGRRACPHRSLGFCRAGPLRRRRVPAPGTRAAAARPRRLPLRAAPPRSDRPELVARSHTRAAGRRNCGLQHVLQRPPSAGCARPDRPVRRARALTAAPIDCCAACGTLRTLAASGAPIADERPTPCSPRARAGRRLPTPIAPLWRRAPPTRGGAWSEAPRGAASPRARLADRAALVGDRAGAVPAGSRSGRSRLDAPRAAARSSPRRHARRSA